MKKQLKNTILIASLLSTTSISAGFKWPIFGKTSNDITINNVIVKKSDAIKGQFIVNVAFGKSKTQVHFPAGSNTSVISQAITENKSGKTEIEIIHTSAVNILPQMSAKTVRLKANVRSEKKNKQIVFAANENETIVNGQSYPQGAIICPNIYNFSVSGKTLIIDLTQYKNLSSCQGSNIWKYSPAFIGHRDLNKQNLNPFPFKDFSINIFPQSVDTMLGSQLAKEVNQENKDLLLPDNHPVALYIQNLATKLANNSDLARELPQIKIKTYVINSNVLNAFAAPGGFVYVYRGLIDAAKNESELASVIAHEIAHVIARHSTKGISLQALALAGALVQLVKDKKVTLNSDAEILQNINNLTATDLIPLGIALATPFKSRIAEAEADRLGSQYLVASNIHPSGLSMMFKNFEARSSDANITTLEKLMRSHPQHAERIAQGEIYSSLFFPEQNYALNSTEFNIMKQNLNRLPVTSDSKITTDSAQALLNAIDKTSSSLISTSAMSIYKNKSYAPILQLIGPVWKEILKAQ